MESCDSACAVMKVRSIVVASLRIFCFVGEKDILVCCLYGLVTQEKISSFRPYFLKNCGVFFPKNL